MRRLLLPLLALLLPVLLVPGTAFGATATVKTASTAAGTVLVNQHGKSLYMFGKDRHGKSSCSGACAAELAAADTTSGKPKAGQRGQSSKRQHGQALRRQDPGDLRRAPAVRFVADRAAGDVNGQGINAFGGIWSLLKRSGSKVSGTPRPQSPSRAGADAEPRVAVLSRPRLVVLATSIGEVQVRLPDGSELDLPDGATGADAAAAIGPGLARAALACASDGEAPRPRATPLPDGDKLADRHRPRRATPTRSGSSATTPPTSSPPR